MLIDGGTVAMSKVAVMDNTAAGKSGSNGANGHSATAGHPTGGAGGDGTAGGDARGGGIYLAGGKLTLTDDLIRATSPRAEPAAAAAAAATAIRYLTRTTLGCGYTLHRLPFRHRRLRRQRRSGR